MLQPSTGKGAEQWWATERAKLSWHRTPYLQQPSEGEGPGEDARGSLEGPRYNSICFSAVKVDHSAV